MAPTFDGLMLALLSEEGQEDPYPIYAAAREQSAVGWIPAGHLLTLSHSACMEALRSPELNAASSPFDALIPPDEREGLELMFELPTHEVLWSNPPQHTRLRTLLQKAFTPRVVRQREAALSEMVDGFLDDMADQEEPDIMTHLGMVLPTTVIATVLGVPTAERDTFKPMADGVARRYSRMDKQALLDGVPAFTDLVAYIEGLIEARRKDPDEGLLSAMVHVSEGGAELSHEEVVANTLLLLIAGHETTTNLIGNGTLALMRNRDQWDLLVADPTRAQCAVEELVRFDAPFQFTGRVAAKDTTIANEPVPEGKRVAVVLGSANHDPDVFHEPDRLDIGRDPNPLLSFGEGIHYCMGNLLARLEGRLVFTKLAQRFPNMDLDPAREIERKPSLALRGLQHLPVTLGR